MKLRQKILIVGGITGAMVGLAAAYLYVKANEPRIAAVEAGDADSVAQVSPKEAVTVGLSILGLLRQIVSLGGGQ